MEVETGEIVLTTFFFLFMMILSFYCWKYHNLPYKTLLQSFTGARDFQFLQHVVLHFKAKNLLFSFSAGTVPLKSLSNNWSILQQTDKEWKIGHFRLHNCWCMWCKATQNLLDSPRATSTRCLCWIVQLCYLRKMRNCKHSNYTTVQNLHRESCLNKLPSLLSKYSAWVSSTTMIRPKWT